MASEKQAPVKEPSTQQSPVPEGPRGDRDPADGTDKPSIEAAGAVDKTIEDQSRIKSNGNRFGGDQSSEPGERKTGGAERGGPDLDKAQDRMPPDSDEAPVDKDV